MGLLGNANINVKVHFGIITLVTIIGGVAVMIWGPPGMLAEYKDFVLWALGILGAKRVLDSKNGGK